MKSKVPVHIFPISIDLQNKVTPQNLLPNQKDPDKKKTHTLIGLVILGIKFLDITWFEVDYFVYSMAKSQWDTRYLTPERS